MSSGTRRWFLEILGKGAGLVGTLLIPGTAEARRVKPAVVEQPKLQRKRTTAPKPKPATPTEYLSEVDRQAHEKIAELRGAGILTPGDRTSVLVYGLQSNKHFVRINADEQRMAASLIKLFVMLAAYHKIASGKKPRKGLEEDIRAMIAHSNNKATNRVLRFVGGPAEAHRIARNYGFDKTKIVEYIPDDGRTYRNKTSARNLSALMWKLHNGELIDDGYSRKMLEHLDVYATSRLRELQTPLHVELAGKTGYVGGLNGEATRVTYDSTAGPKHYTFVAMVENPAMKNASAKRKRAWGQKTSRVIRQVFQTVHENMTA